MNQIVAPLKPSWLGSMLERSVVWCLRPALPAPEKPSQAGIDQGGGSVSRLKIISADLGTVEQSSIKEVIFGPSKIGKLRCSGPWIRR